MKIALITAPYDSGHYRQRLGLGAEKLREGVEVRLRNQGHDVRSEQVIIATDFSTEVTTSFAVSRQVARLVGEAKGSGALPVVLSGNCNMAAIGTLGGLEDNSGVIWFDCHGDFNTPETTIGGFLDGMALSMVTGHCWTQLTASVPGFKAVPEDKVILIGARDFDPLELTVLEQSAITTISPSMIKDESAVRMRLMPMKSVYLHIDLDVLDPDYVRVNTYSTAGGLSPEELYDAVRLIKNNYRISALAFTAYDPSLDAEGKVQGVVNNLLDIIIKE